MKQKLQLQKSASLAEREQRVADALRENLRKRKAQASAQQAKKQEQK